MGICYRSGLHRLSGCPALGIDGFVPLVRRDIQRACGRAFVELDTVVRLARSNSPAALLHSIESLDRHRRRKRILATPISGHILGHRDLSIPVSLPRTEAR